MTEYPIYIACAAFFIIFLLFSMRTRKKNSERKSRKFMDRDKK